MIERKVSVCISTCNRIELLKFAVESVLAQSYSDWELIVCDDGSTDGTSDYMSQIENDQIHYIRHPKNIGKSNNMRSGFEAARGEYFVKFDDDDILLANFLKATVPMLDKYSNIDFVGGDHWIIDINNNRDEEWSDRCSTKFGRTKLQEGIVDDLLKAVFIDQSFYIGATLFRSCVLKEINYMRENLQSCEDNDLFVRLALANKVAYYLPQRLMEYRFHSEQKQRNKAIAHLDSQIKYLSFYKFSSVELEKARESELTRVKRQLGLCLLETEDSPKAKQLVLEGCSNSKIEELFGRIITTIPSQFVRKTVIDLLRKLKGLQNATKNKI